jgi:co-chaperonin GroES (HSP10)
MQRRGKMQARYLTKIKEVADKGLLVLNGNRLLIELLEEDEQKTASGIVVSVKPNPLYSSVDKARLAVVLATGPGYVTEADEKVDLAYKAGDYIIVNQFGVKTFEEFLGLADYKKHTLALVTDDLIHGKISNYAEFSEILKK